MKSWHGKVVLVTGGSAGLGFCIAQAFAERGATIAIVGRDPDRLNSAAKGLRDQGHTVDTYTADVTIDGQIEEAIRQLGHQHGRLDVLVNNVGRSARGKVLETPPQEFQDLIEVNFLSVVRCTLAAMPLLTEHDGHVVNIASLSAKTVSPYLCAYAASKFPVAAYTAQLRLEGPRNVHFMLVCPGPISRKDAGGRYDDQVGHLPEKARQPAAGAKVKSTSAEEVARQIVTGCDRRWPELVIPSMTRILFGVAQLWPKLGDWILRKWT